MSTYPGSSDGSEEYRVYIPQNKETQETRSFAEIISEWLGELPKRFEWPPEPEDVSDRTITLHRRIRHDYTGYPIPVQFADPNQDIKTEDTFQDVSSFLRIVRKIEILESLEGIGPDELEHPLHHSIIASRAYDQQKLPSGHKLWDRDIVLPVLNEAIQEFRKLVDPNPDRYLDWFHLPGDLLKPYVMSGQVVPLDEKHYLGFDMYQRLRLGSHASSILSASQAITSNIDPQMFQTLVAVIRPCATEPKGPQEGHHRILHALYRLAPTIHIQIRYLWQVKNLFSGKVKEIDSCEIWLPVLLYEGPKWYFFVARTHQGKMTAIRIRWSANTNSITGCKKLLSLLLVLLAWARSIHLPWLIDNIFGGVNSFDVTWKSVIGSLIIPEPPREKLKQLLGSLPCGQIPL